MTKEEAIKLIEHIGIMFVPTDQYGDYDDPQPYEEALDMAIEALQNPSKPNNTCEVDIISRQDAIRWVKTECNPYGKPTLDFESGKKVIEHLGQMPSVETPTVSEKHQLSKETPTNTPIDLISRQDVEVRVNEYFSNKSYTEKMLKDDIKSLPSAKPCDKDAVSREGLLKSWEELSPRGRIEFDQVIMTIPALPSAEPNTECIAQIRIDRDDLEDLVNEKVNEIVNMMSEPNTEWIPCSERLPDDSGNYLITVADLRLGHIGEYTVTMADFYAKAKKWNSIVDAYAWMPLPPAYQR